MHRGRFTACAGGGAHGGHPRRRRTLGAPLPVGALHTHVHVSPCAQSFPQVGNASTVLGFVGAPFTLATYIVEGAPLVVRVFGACYAAVLVFLFQPQRAAVLQSSYVAPSLLRRACPTKSALAWQPNRSRLNLVVPTAPHRRHVQEVDPDGSADSSDS